MDKNINIWVFICLGIVLGGIGAYFSKNLHKIQIWITNFFAVFYILPGVLSLWIASDIATFISVLVAILIASLSVKYRYVVTVITTSIQGAFFAVSQGLLMTGNNNTTWLFIGGSVLAALGMLVQKKVGKGEEKEKMTQPIVEVK